jgi:hypothetical protein
LVNPDLNETALKRLEDLVAIELEQYHNARVVDTGVVIRDMTTEEFQRY